MLQIVWFKRDLRVQDNEALSRAAANGHNAINAENSNSPTCSTMAHKKFFLPSRACLSCGREFSWRKRWRANWQQVLYCSERCRRNKGNRG
jgi:hypothetical protein